MAKFTPQEPFPYEDNKEASIRLFIEQNNKYDLSGRLNELRLPSRRIQQQLRKAKWYEPKQHALSPHISASISAPSVLKIGSPYTITITIQHHENLAGNPESRPVTFDLSNVDCGVDGSVHGDGQVYPWLLLLEDPSALEGGLKEIEAEEEGHGPAVPWEVEGNETETYVEPQPRAVTPGNGFVTLAVRESKTFEVKWREPKNLVKERERYKICYRGVFFRWWTWGTVSDLKDSGTKVGPDRPQDEWLFVSCTNVVGFTVET